MELECDLADLNVNSIKFHVLLGDFNIDLLQDEQHLSLNLIGVTSSFGLTQIISEPTRPSKLTATLNDHVYINQFLTCRNYSISPLLASIHLQMPLVSPCPRHLRCEVWFYSKDDFESVNEVLLLNLPDTSPDRRRC